MGVMDEESDVKYMDLALAEAKKAEAAGEVPVGAVIVADGTVIGRGFNQPISAADPTAHAEIIALREAARKLGNYRLSKVTMYSTVEPCTMCAGAMIHARIARLVFGAPDPKAGSAGSIYNVLTDPRLNHRVDVFPGVREAECAALLRDFFLSRRA
jgi:tRNA(Arg) A34 adenosine deaminase TadA